VLVILERRKATLQCQRLKLEEYVIKRSGREEGKRCVIVDVLDKNFVLITAQKLSLAWNGDGQPLTTSKITEEKIKISKGSNR